MHQSNVKLKLHSITTLNNEDQTTAGNKIADFTPPTPPCIAILWHSNVTNPTSKLYLP